MGGYHEDLAYVHAVGFSDFARRAAPGLVRLLRRHGVERGLVVDLGCGNGVLAGDLVKAGYQVMGLDLSRAMVALARRRAPRARFEVGSFLDAALPACDAVTATGECISYLLDGRNRPDRLELFFRRVHDALRPRGVFVLDFAAPGRGGPAGTQRSGFRGKDWALLLELLEDRRKRTLVRRITTFRKVGGAYRRREEEHALRLYRAREVTDALERAGFMTKVIRRYGRLALGAGHVGVVARRPGWRA